MTRFVALTLREALIPPTAPPIRHEVRHRAAGRQAAVDHELAAGRAAGEVGAEEQHHVGDLLDGGVAGLSVAPPGSARSLAAARRRAQVVPRAVWIMRCRRASTRHSMRIPCRATSPAAVLVRPITARLRRHYIGMPGVPTRPATEAVFTTAPPPRADHHFRQHVAQAQEHALHVDAPITASNTAPVVLGGGLSPCPRCRHC